MGTVVLRMGEDVVFPMGAKREFVADKPRYDLISLPAMRRLAIHMAAGVEKYSERNWEKGMPMTRYEQGLLRHVFQYMEGDRQEDHAAAVLFNMGCIMHHEEEIRAGRLPESLDDRPSIRRLEYSEEG